MALAFFGCRGCRRWLQEVVGAGERREKVLGFHLQNDHKICDCALGYLKNSCNDLRGNDPPTTKNNARDCIIFVGVYVAHVEFVLLPNS